MGLLPFLLIIIICLTGPYAALAWGSEEPYPHRAVNIIVNYAPGGTIDTHAKIVGDKLSEILGQPFLRVHKPGGGGTLGASLAAKAKPDGYTLFLATSGNLMLAPTMKKVDYTWEDFTPLATLSKGVVNLYVKSDAQWKTLRDFIQGAKNHPLKVTSYGKFTHADMVIEVFSKQAGIKLAHIPYKNCMEAATPLMGGHVDGDFCTSSMGQVEAGALRILATADFERSKIYPEVKTFKELGYPVAFPVYYSICAPQKTPKPIVQILANALREMNKRYAAEINGILINMELQPYFLDSSQSLQDFKREYEVVVRTVKEFAMFEK
jgi:tripartite-type tricarboxylate transporter receptor subunit TctC